MDSFDELSGGNSLSMLFVHLMDSDQAICKMELSRSKMRLFLEDVQSTYGSNPYHNRMHGADVMLGMHLFLRDFSFSTDLSALERLAALFAAALHDVGHPGTTNGHEIKAIGHSSSLSTLAVQYNDASVLESYHCATAFEKLLNPRCNFLSGLGREKFAEFRKLVIKMILATDLSKHFDFLSQLKSIQNGRLALSTAAAAPAASTTEFLKPALPAGVGLADSQLVFATAIKFADIGHTLKPWDQHERWSLRVQDEMFLLGDKERGMELPVSPLCDRYSEADSALAENQIKFFDFICAPFYKAVARVVPLAHDRVLSLERNYAGWQSRAAELRGTVLDDSCYSESLRKRPSVTGSEEPRPFLVPITKGSTGPAPGTSRADEQVVPPNAFERAIGARMRILGGTATQVEDGS